MNFKATLNYGKYAAVASVLSIFTLAGCEKHVQEQEPMGENPDAQRAISQSSGPQFVANEVLVKFRAGTPDEMKAKAIASISGEITERILTKAMEHAGDKEGLTLIHTPLATQEAVSIMSGNGTVAYAEPNFIYQHNAISTDTYFKSNSLWGMYGDASVPANQYGCQAAEAWAAGHTGSASVIVGVIDEGIQVNHPELSGQVWVNPFDPVDGIDNDGNGYRDDTNGWDFTQNNNSVYDGGTFGFFDDHGTHVAGTIGAKSNNAGVVGVNWNVTMISCKFLSYFGGTTANAVKAVDYLNDLKTRHGLNIVASNNSWGGGGFSQALYDAVNRANTRNILFVAAAGNGGSDGVGDNNDVVASYPSNMTLPNIIAVAAITSAGAKSPFSNYGATTVDIGAPGSGIMSTTAYNTYSSYNGTSMATPHVTGAAALYAAYHTSATAADIKNAIMNSAVPTASLSGKCVTNGRPNVSGF